MQYTQEQYCLTSGWAPLVTCHPLPGPGVIDGLMSVAPPGSGCVLVAEMSSSGTLAVGEYTKGTVCVYGKSFKYIHYGGMYFIDNLSCCAI